MRHVIDNQFVLARAPEGPLAAWLDGFARFLSAKGYAASTIRQRVQRAVSFSYWLMQEQTELSDLTSDHPALYLQDRALQVITRRNFLAGLRQLLEFLRLEGVVAEEPAADSPTTQVDQCVHAYEQYLRDMRGLVDLTIQSRSPVVRRFLEHRFGDGQVALPQLSASDVVEFVQREVSPTTKRNRAKVITIALRSFLGYVGYRGEAMPDLVAAVPAVAEWPMASIPRAISPDEVHQLLTGIDRDTPKGRRNYAVLLLLARLGLRAGEIASLQLDDIDWTTGTMQVRTKGGHCNAFPLTHEIGEAIADYLRNGRPRSDSRRVFLRSKAPIRGFRGGSTVVCIVDSIVKQTGVNTPTRGTHQFRHGLATEMLRQGASLGEIGELLGHRHPDTTRIYAKVDIDALRALAMPWPGGVR
ncbi:MAG: site-specific integrase [Chloroflexi bacterium]|nr:site-specific integrase [Chloroflexota bacterium]